MPFKNRKKNKCWKCQKPIEYTAKSCQKHILRTAIWKKRIGIKTKSRKERLGYFHTKKGIAGLKSAGKESWLANQKGKDSPSWKGGKIVVAGYFYIYAPGHPLANKNKRVAEHRLVMEKKIGRYLLRSEQVHHINGNRQDNRIENLELHTHSSHAKYHSSKKIRNKSGQFHDSKKDR